jgi:hypothetical protein
MTSGGTVQRTTQTGMSNKSDLHALLRTHRTRECKFCRQSTMTKSEKSIKPDIGYGYERI